MDREHYIKDMPKHIEKIRAQVARISASEEICQQAIQLIREILEAANSTIIIDANDIRECLNEEGILTTFDVSVCASNTERMKELVKQVENKIADIAPIKSLLFHLSYPEEHPLLMSELQPLSDWLSSIPCDSDLTVKWGVSATKQSTNTQLRVIMLAVA